MNGCRRAMGRDCIASRATRPKSMSVLRHAVVKRSRKDIGPLSRSTIEGRHPDTSRFFRYEPDCRRPQRRCLVSSCVKIGAPTMRALNDHRKFRSGGAIVGAGLVGLVPESVLELILGLALAYSTLVTLRQLNVEIPAEPRVDPLAMSFADGGHGEEEPDAHVAEPRPEIGGGRAARRGDDGDDAGAHRVAQVDAVEHGEDRYEHDAAARGRGSRRSPLPRSRWRGWRRGRATAPPSVDPERGRITAAVVCHADRAAAQPVDLATGEHEVPAPEEADARDEAGVSAVAAEQLIGDPRRDVAEPGQAVADDGRVDGPRSVAFWGRRPCPDELVPPLVLPGPGWRLRDRGHGSMSSSRVRSR